MHYNVGSILMFLSPFIIIIVGLSNFYAKISSSYFKAQLLRENYKKTILKELIHAYIKPYSIFAIISLVVFAVGIILFNDKITNTTIADYYSQFDYFELSNPYYFVILSFPLLFLYITFVVNIGLIVMHFVKKLNIAIIVSFVTINAINFIMGNTLILIGHLISNESFLNYVYNVNIFEGFFVQSTMYRALLHNFIYVILSFAVLFMLYRDKEKTVMNFE